MSQVSDGKHQEDDGIDLVQQILAENPPEEKGEREEWSQHVGWHRKEDIHRKASLRGASNSDAKFPNAGEQDKDIISIPTKSNANFWNGRETLIRAGCAMISLVCLLVFCRRILHLSSARSRRSKNR